MKDKLASIVWTVSKSILAGVATGIGLEVADTICTFVKKQAGVVEKKRVDAAVISQD